MSGARRPAVVLDHAQITKLAASLSRFRFRPDRFDEPLLYPAADDTPARAASFFFFLTAIDHRTHGPGTEYRGDVGGVALRGAELLWALGKRRYAADPQFFTADRMAAVTDAEVADTFRVDSPEVAEIRGPEERAALLRDAGTVLRRDFGGSVLRLIDRSGGFLQRPDGTGLLQLLKGFRAYSDPLAKKPFLLVKFLERRGFLTIRDPGNAHVPVDNVLQRVALRTGIVRIEDPRLEKTIRSRTAATAEEDALLRSAVSQAFDDLASAMGTTPTSIDDVFWEFGRIHCTAENPFCDSLPDDSAERVRRLISQGPVGPCPFGAGCLGFKNPNRWELREPVFETLYY